MMAPWFHEMNQRNELGIADCGRCKQDRTKLERQSLGCGYEPPAKGRVHLTLWQPPAGSGSVGYRGPEATVCAGYTVRLPEVREAALARLHWEKGNLGAALGCKSPSEKLLNAILIYTGEHNAAQRWALTPSSDGGGGT